MLKSIAWYINSILTASLVIYSFPVVLVSVLFMFPLLHYATNLFKLSKASLWSHLNFVLWLSLSVLILLDTVVLPSTKYKSQYSIQNMVITSINDYHCVGSNVWMYLCCIFVPNLLVILQIQLFSE